MGRDSTWTNDDGLVVGFGTRTSTNDEGGNIRTSGIVEEYVIKINDATTLGDTDTAAVAGSFPGIPAEAVIKSAYLKVTTAFTSGGLATLDIGLKQRAGTNIDADGIDVDIAVADLSAGAVIVCDGALIGARIGSNEGVPMFTYETAAFTAGAAELVIEYIRDVA